MSRAPLLLASILASAAPAAAGAAAPANTWESGNFNLLPRGLQLHPRLDVMIVTEFTQAGRKLPAASPQHPQYYIEVPGQYVEVGDIVAGERKPPDADLAAIVKASLAQAGYRPARRGHPPTIALFYRWGSFNRLTPLGQMSDPDAVDDGSDDLANLNLIERATLVGGTKFAVELAEAMNSGTLSWFESRNPRTSFLLAVARGDLYFVMVSAYDYAAAAQDQRVALWRTMISTDSRGVTMDESVPQLVASAAPYLGHDTAGPVRLNRPVVPEGKVLVGVPTVKEVLPPDTPPEMPPAPPSAGAGK